MSGILHVNTTLTWQQCLQRGVNEVHLCVLCQQPRVAEKVHTRILAVDRHLCIGLRGVSVDTLVSINQTIGCGISRYRLERESIVGLAIVSGLNISQHPISGGCAKKSIEAKMWRRYPHPVPSTFKKITLTQWLHVTNIHDWYLN